MQTVKASTHKDGMNYAFEWKGRNFTLNGTDFWFHLLTKEDISKDEIVKDIEAAFKAAGHRTRWSSQLLEFKRGQSDITLWIADLRFSTMGPGGVEKILSVLIGEHEISFG